MKATAWIGWIVATALCLGGCGVQHLNAAAKARLDTVGVAVAEYRPLTIVPPAPANYVTALGQYSLHYGHKLGGWGSLPLYAAPYAGYAAAPLVVIGMGLSLVTTTAGAAYGSVYSLLRPPIDAERARRSTSDLRQIVDSIDFQQALAATFFGEATAVSRHRFEQLPDLGLVSRQPRQEPLNTPITFPRQFAEVRFVRTTPFASRPAYHEHIPEHIHSVLELKLDRVQFIGTEEALTLVLQGQARLLMPRWRSTAPDFRPVETVILDFTSEPAPYQAWSTADGALLKTTLEEGCHTLARSTVERWFY